MRAYRSFFAAFSLIVAVALAGAAPAFAQDDGPPTLSEGSITSKLPNWLGGDQPEFFRMPAFNVPTIRERGVVGLVTLNITLETRGLANKEKLIENRTYLRNAFLRDIYGVASINNGTGKALNLDTVKRRLQMVADRVLGEGVVHDILVQNAFTRGDG